MAHNGSVYCSPAWSEASGTLIRNHPYLLGCSQGIWIKN